MKDHRGNIDIEEPIQARATSFKSVTQEAKNPSTGLCSSIITVVAWIICILIPIFWFFMFRTVRDYERALIFRLGKLTGGARGPGLFVINPLIDTIRVVDLRIETVNLRPQDMMTKDSVTVKVDGVVYCKVVDAEKAILEVDDYRTASSMFSATSLRSVVGMHDLETILSQRLKLNEALRQTIEQETQIWGVTVTSVEIKDVILPPNMQRAMAAESEAERERRAKVINAVGEHQAAEKIALAARTISKEPGALQLRYLHTLKNIAVERNSTILFPLPMELMRGFSAMNEMMNPKDLKDGSDMKV